MSLLSANLEAFLAVKQHLTVAAAANQLRLTQAAVTLRIQNLERDTNSNLFTRSRRGMRLTSAGEALARYCQRALELEAETLPDLNPDPGKPSPIPFVFQGPSSPMRKRVIPHMASYLKAYPYIAMELRVTDLESGIYRLKGGEADLVIAQRHQIGKEFDSKLLKPERYILAAPTAWRKRSVKEILHGERIIDFDPTDDMTFRFLKKHDLLSEVRLDRHFVNVTESIAELMAEGLGYSTLSMEVAAPHLESGKLFNLCPGKFYDYEVALAWYPRKHVNPSFRDLLKLIR